MAALGLGLALPFPFLLGGGAGNFQASLLYKNNANQYFVFVPRNGTQMALFEFVNNSTTNTDSLAVTNADITRFRLSGIRTATDVYVCQRTHSATSGTWTDNRSTGNIPPMQTWNSGVQPTFDSTTTSGGYREYLVAPVNGQFTVSLRALSTGSSSVTVTINGGSPDTLSLANGTTQIITRTYTGQGVAPVTVRVTNNTAAELGIVGINFQTLRGYNGAFVDKIGWGRNTVNYADYLTQSSSNDSVAKEFTSGIYGGGYHGGETGITDDFLVNGASQALSIGTFAIGSVEIRTACNVSWAGVGGGSMAWNTRWTFPFGAVQMAASVSGNLRAAEFFTTMGGFSTAFSQVTSPVSIDLAAAADNTRHPLGNLPACTLLNPTTSQRIDSSFHVFDPAQNVFGGPHFWHVVASYNKLYNGPVVQGDLTVTELSYVTRHTVY